MFPLVYLRAYYLRGYTSVTLSRNRFFCLFQQFILSRMSCKNFKVVFLILPEQQPSTEQPLGGSWRNGCIKVQAWGAAAWQGCYESFGTYLYWLKFNTQNNNISYNSLLWHFPPKHLHNGLKTIGDGDRIDGLKTRRSYVIKHPQKRDEQLGEKL